MWRHAWLALALGCAFDPRGTADDGGGPPDGPGPDGSPPAGYGLPGGVPAEVLWWVDAASVTTAPLVLRDRSDRRIDATAPSAVATPTLDPTGLNDNPVLRFADDRLDASAPVFADGTVYRRVALFIVFDDATTSSFDWLLHEGRQGNDRFSVSKDFNGSGLIDVDFTTDARVRFASAPRLALSVIADADATPSLRGSANGGTTVTGTFAGYTGTGRRMQMGDRQGSGGDPSAPYDGALAEAYLVTSPLTDGERRRIESYLALRWGTPSSVDLLASDDAVVWPVSAGAYAQGRVGLARDDASGLDQRQSRAPGSPLELAVAEFAASNRDNLTRLPTDRSFVIASHDSGGLDFGATTGRLGRVWRLVTTGSPGTITVRVRLAPGADGLPVPVLSQLRVWTSSTSDFASHDELTPTIAADTASISLSPGPGTSYLTFALAP